jgi:uncharacterized protein (TIGR00251 family)
MGALIVPEIRLSVRVKPGASRAKVGGSHDGALIISVNAPPVDGAANVAVITALAEALGVKSRQIRVVAGHTGRTKILAIDTDEPDRVREEISRLTAPLPNPEMTR